MWFQMFNLHLVSVDTVLKTIDDALCMGFEFKVEAGNIYFREIV